MAEIVVLPFPGEFALRGLFQSGTSAEGRLAWFETLARTTLSPGERAVIAVGFDAGEPRGALPLVLGSAGVRALTAPYTTRYSPPLPDPQVARALGLRAREFVPGALRLDGLDPEEPGTAALLDGLLGSGLTFARYRGFANWYEPVTDFESWWSVRPSRLKSTVRRKLSAASKAGAEFACFHEYLDEAIAIYQEVYADSWKDAEPHPEFMPAMVRALGGEGLVRVGIMSIDGRPAAVQVWLVCGRHGTIFKLAHREAAAVFSPGTLLTHFMARTLIGRDGLNEIDFGRGDDGYKRDWLGRCRRRAGVVAGDWRKRAGLTAIVEDVWPARLSAFVRSLGRHSGIDEAPSAAAAASGELSLTGLRRMTGDAGPGGRGTAGR